jgi:hypothetical protein
MLVRIIKNWEWPDLFRQTPESSGIWDNIQFTSEPVDACDYLIVLNKISDPAVVVCPPENLWAIIQEPPVDEYLWLYRGLDSFYRIYTPETRVLDAQLIPSHGALPWQVNKHYDELLDMPVPAKNKRLSWITSNKRSRPGHKARLSFLDLIGKRVVFDLRGRGFSPIADKWDGLAPYYYSLAIENYSAPYYWTEKLSDCFLSWTMPLYYGCTNISDYFPAESFIQIDINDPHVGEQINDVINSDLWSTRIEAVGYARELVLNRYQFFPFVAERIRENLAQGEISAAQKISFTHGNSMPLKQRLKRRIANLTWDSKRD